MRACLLILNFVPAVAFADAVISPDGRYSVEIVNRGEDLLIRDLKTKVTAVINNPDYYPKELTWIRYEGWPYLICNWTNAHRDWFSLVNPGRGRAVISQAGSRYKNVGQNELELENSNRREKLSFEQLIKFDLPPLSYKRAKAYHPALVFLTPLGPPSADADTFYPLGFSKNGLFAYLIDLNYRGTSSFNVIDLRNDKVVKGIFFEASVSSSMKMHRSRLTRLLRKFGISNLPNQLRNPFPLLHKGVAYAVEYRKELGFALEKGAMGTKAPTFNPEPSGYIKLFLKNSAGQRKEIGHLNVDSGRNIDRIEGYYLSPHENRIVVVTSGLESRFEGDMVIGFHLFGAHLHRALGESLH